MVKRLSDATELQLTGATITSAKNIKKDNYDVSITGTKTGTDIGIDYSVAGTVSNPITNPSTLSFTLSNINTGHLTIEVLDGAASRLLQTFTITLPPPAPPAPIDAGSDEAPAAAAPAAPPAAPQALLAPPGVSATTVSLQQNEEGKVLAEYVIETDPAAGFSATVDITLGTTVVTATGQPVGEISITPLDPATVTEATVDQSGVFSFSGFSVECEPTGAQFSGGSVTISFSLTPAQWAEALGKVNGNTAAMTIQTYDPATKSWIDVPTTVDPVTHTVSAQITHFTTYALFYKIAKEVPTTSPPTFGDMVPAATMTTLAPGTTPVKTMLAPPSTTESPGLPGIVVIGVVGFVGFFVMKRRQ